MLHQQGHVTTDRASRYLGQLCEHLNQIGRHGSGHGPTGQADGPPQVRHIEWNDSRGTIVFPFGQCVLTVTTDSLTLRLAADNTDNLQRMKDTFTKRLETISRRDTLTIGW